MRLKRGVQILTTQVPLERGRLFFVTMVPTTKLRVWRTRLMGQKVRIIVGADTHISYPGWIDTWRDTLDIARGFYWRFYFPPGSVDNVLVEHVLEHIEPAELPAVFRNIHTALRVGGVFRVAVPDGYHPSGFFKEFSRPGGWGAGADDHKTFFTVDMMRELAQTYGFECVPVEYFDRSGTFHTRPMSDEHGTIKRTARKWIPELEAYLTPAQRAEFFDTIPAPLRAQFTQSGMLFTSLWVDFVKK
ncbi:MAG: hypothetical protein KGI70_02030 [Patescibacteria group bacterium]|nr:hypothetical protein [Patescibacteria group bacterium]